MDGLKYSLLSMSQIYDKGKVKFISDKCIVTRLKDSEIMLIAWRNKNMYVVDLESCNTKNLTCISV